MVDWIIPITLGVSAVLQAAINRTLISQASIGSVVFLNSIVVLTYAMILSLVLKQKLWGFTQMPWPILLSGFFGFVLVTGFPYSIGKVGAVATAILFVLANLLASAAWDIFVEGIPMTPLRWGALGLACASAALFSISKSPV